MNTLNKLSRFGICLPGCAMSASAAENPNVVLIITDDQGYGDLSVHGNPVLKRPNMDRLHSELPAGPYLRSGVCEEI
jgi:hypothetical protein